VTRIIAGKAGSLKLDVPQGPTRPTSERVREAMFSSIEHLVDLDGARVLDLYAGSGALGLEAASRGATDVVFVDSSKKVERVLTKNINRLQASLTAGHTFQVVTSEATAYCERIPPGELFDLVMMDPPYEVSPMDITHCLQALKNNLVDDGLIIVERSKKSPEPQWPQQFQVVKQKTYGDTALFYLTQRR
jgi:16S rRNA (guanine966-N2)-methyltransferase